MWCANCNKTSYSDVCEVCGGKTQQDTPIELYWCDNCRVPIIREVSDTSPMICPSCGKTIRYLAKDLRPVFPEERLLLEVVKGTPLAFINSSVWASGSRYYIDGKTANLSIETLKKIMERDFKAAALQDNLEEPDEHSASEKSKARQFAEKVKTTITKYGNKEETMAAIAAYLTLAQ